MADMQKVTINGANLSYTTIGSGPAIMVLHGGLGLDHTYLRPYFDQLADNHTVVFYDHFGNGASDRPASYDELTLARLADDAEGLRAHLDLGQVVMIGHSYGGFVAQTYAAAHGGNLRGLVLVDTVPALDYAPALSGTDEQMAALGAMFGGPMPDDDTFRATWTKVIQMYFKDYDAGVGDRLDANTTYCHEAWNRANALLAEYNVTDALSGLTMPVLAIGGRHDGITPPEQGAERIAGLVPGARAQIFENSAHYPFIEEEEAFFATLRDWLAAL